MTMRDSMRPSIDRMCTAGAAFLSHPGRGRRPAGGIPAPAVRDGQLVVRTTMTLTLSIDHRVLDGATGALFLADLSALLEHPLRIVL